MSPEEHRALIQRIFTSLFVNDDDAAVDTYFASDVVDHSAPLGRLAGVEGVKQVFHMFHNAFPNRHITLEDFMVEGDIASSRSTIRAVHQGTWMGIPATGKHVTWGDIRLLRFQDGKIAEHWVEWDALGLLEQLGAVPSIGHALGAAPGRVGEMAARAHHRQADRQTSPAENKAIIRRWLDGAWNAGNPEAITELVHPYAVRRDGRHHFGFGSHHADAQRFVGMVRAAFPDIHMTIEDQLAEDDKVATRWTLGGTQQGAILGVPASGKYGSVTGLDISRIVNGQVVEHHSEWDSLGFLRQLGLLPPAL
jgi:steroid delta-isomerase-like uncharacterized protein